MTKWVTLKQISTRIEKALADYKLIKEWQAYDAALVGLCRPLSNRVLQTVLPKVVAVDRLYTADLIRYLPKPADGEEDYRPGRYVEIARAITALDVDNCFAALQKPGSRFGVGCLDKIIEIHTTVADAVRQVTERNGEVFASKYLHFCRQEYFPIMDSWSRSTAGWIMGLTDDQGEYLVAERFGYDDTGRPRYDRFCRAALAIQAALAGQGLGQYTLPELDRYLYYYER